MFPLAQLLLFVVFAHGALAQVLYVDSDASGSYDGTCGNRSSPCPTLEVALSNRNADSVTIHILSSTLTLGHPIELENITAFHLRGRDVEGTLITCPRTSTSLPGLVFLRVDNVTLSYVQFSACGALVPYNLDASNESSTTYSDPSSTSGYNYRAVLHFYKCSDVSIFHMNVSHNHGAGVAIIDPLGGVISISNSNFSNNRVPAQDISRYSGGTGIYIRERRASGEDESVTIRVSHCTFEHNRATFPGFSSAFNEFNQSYMGTGRGGGLDVILSRNASYNSIQVFNCRFRNNTAYVGGGLAVQLYDDSNHNSISIERCVFEQNGCVEGLRTGSGGGVHFGYSFNTDETLEPKNNQFLIRNSTFRQNCAHLGGGLTLFTSRSNQIETALSNNFLLDNCSWTGNIAYVGTAVDISPHVQDRTREGFLPTPLFKDCNFTNNHLTFEQEDFHQSFGSGTLFSSLFNIDFVGRVYFENNTGSAFVIVNAIANFSLCDAVFVGNTGVQGGAVSMIGVSALLIGPGRVYNFTRNRATDRGGAIYNYMIDDHDFAASRSCFLYYSDLRTNITEWNVSLYFIDNTAGTYGHSIFSSSVLSCIYLDDDGTIASAAMIFNRHELFHYDERTENQVATEAGSFIATESLPFHIIPGDEHELDIVTTDDVGQQIETIFRASMIENSGNSIHVDETFSCVSGNVVELKGKTRSSGVLLLETMTSRKRSIAMNVTLQPCPPGFVLSGDKCSCNTETYVATVGCDMANFQAAIKLGYWAGYIENDTFVTSICPLAFCAYNDTTYEREVPLPRVTNSSHLDEYICGPTRTGTLCGSCKTGYSVFYHSPSYNCHKSQYCEWGWLFYILSELVPITLMFVVILALNISFTSGHINGFILFSQLLDPVIVNGSGVVQYPQVISVLSWGYQLIYGVFSIEFFNIEPLSFCLWEGATVLDVLAFRYVTVTYALLLVLLTLLFLKYRGHVLARKYLRITTIKNSVIHGLSAFVILCYAQTTKVSIYILTNGYVRGKNGEILTTRVFFNGDTASFSVDHLPYALPAIACLMTISSIPPALFLLYPSVNKMLAFCKLSDTRAVKAVSKQIPINKLKPFLDSFQGCFRDDLRFFAGIYFLYRWIALVMLALIPSITGFYTSLGNVYIIVLLLHAVFQPYTRRVYNIIDGFLFANLALIYSIAGYNYLFSQGLIETFSFQNTYITTTASIQLILIYLPIVGMSMYIGLLLYQRNQQVNRARTFSESEYVVVQPPKRIVTSTDIEELIDGPEEFPPRMLQTDYESYDENQSNSTNTLVDYCQNQLSEDTSL